MHALPIPFLELLITHLIGLRLLKLISRDFVSKNIAALSFYVRDCASPSCSSHSAFLDSYAQDLVNVLLVSARNCVPSRSVSIHQKLAVWSKKAQVLKMACNFWYRVWSEAGCPKHARSRFKSEVRRLRRGQDKILRCKLATAFAQKEKNLILVNSESHK